MRLKPQYQTAAILYSVFRRFIVPKTMKNLPAQNTDLPIQGESPRLALIVDDDKVNRIILKTMLSNRGFSVVTAENGKQAVELFIKYEPNIILMDIMMPVMDGYEATRRIKNLVGDRYVPVIFLTSIVEDDELAKCVEVGGDDFLSKPFSQVILMAKIEALSRMEALYNTVKTQRDAIDRHNARLLLEQKVAKQIFSRIVHEGCLDIGNLRYELSPLAIFNGDLLLAARTPSGGMNILLGDATGHGLPAAIGAVPVSDIFYAMTETGATIDEIVLEINAKLKSILPSEFFVCASILNISNDSRLLTIWHGALPDVLIYSSQERRLLRKIPSTNFPLGVVDNERLEAKPLVFELHEGDRIFLYSDGITEARNKADELFGEQRLLECFNQGLKASELFDHILSEVEKFRGREAQSDDLTLLEVSADKKLLDNQFLHNYHGARVHQPEHWQVSMQLDANDLRTTNPASILTRFATGNNELVSHRENIFIILSELYNNALDHGVLELDSSMKQGADGFSMYLQLREQRLAQLTNGYVNLLLSYERGKKGGSIELEISDSGKGFDSQACLEPEVGGEAHHGRGISLVRSLCTYVTFSNSGSTVKARYEWESPRSS